MNEYRDLAFEAITTLGVIVDLLDGEQFERIGRRVDSMAMKLAIFDSDAAEENALAAHDANIAEECASADADPEQADKCEPDEEEPEMDEPGEHYTDLPVSIKPAPVPVIDVIRRKKVEGTEGMKVTRLPGTEVKPLPNEHAPNLKGSGRAGKPKAMFRMRRIGDGAWFTGSASECAEHFGVTPSQVYKWAGGKAKSGNFEAARI